MSISRFRRIFIHNIDNATEILHHRQNFTTATSGAFRFPRAGEVTNKKDRNFDTKNPGKDWGVYGVVKIFHQWLQRH